MNLENFNVKDLGKNLLENNFISNFVNEFVNELKERFEKDNDKNIENTSNNNKYNDYWEYQNSMEDKLSAKIGLSKWGANITYRKELNKAIDDSILELSEKEGPLYRKDFSASGQFFNVQKFEDGEISNIRLETRIFPKELYNKDIIFQYNEEGNFNVRDDLKEEVINLASPKVANLKVKENERNKEYKKEGHIYEAIEDDGYVFLKDITENRDFVIEDIDFVTQVYNGDGKYQVLNGKYQKVNE